MRLHYTASRGWHLCIPAAHRNALRQSAESEQLFIEQQRRKKHIYCTTASLKTLNHSLDRTWADIMRCSQRVLTQLLQQLQSKMALLHSLSEVAAELDMLYCFAVYSLKGSTRMTRPNLMEGDEAPISITNSKHPILEHLAQHKVVDNTVSIVMSRRLQIINGPNGAGKSTLIKQAALLCIMAHIGCFVPAQFATIKLLDQVFSRLAAADNMLRNESSFFRECKDMAYILSHCGPRSLVIVDELGRATSSIDAFSFAWACCERLKQTKAYTLFATHFDLAPLCKLYPDVTAHAFRMQMEQNKIRYSYRLHPVETKRDDGQHGQDDDHDPEQHQPTNQHYGVVMAELTGFPGHITDDARRILQDQEAVETEDARPMSNYEMAVIMKEHTESIRGNDQLDRDQLIDIIETFKATFARMCS